MNLLNKPSKPLYSGEIWWIEETLLVLVPERPLKWEPAHTLRDFHTAFILKPGSDSKQDSSKWWITHFFPADSNRLHPIELENCEGETLSANLAVVSWADDWFTDTNLIPRCDAWAK